MDVINRIDALMKERNWSDYRLSLESGLSTSTIANIHRRNTVPSIPTLEAICQAFGISLSQFFAEDESFSMVYLSEEQKKMFDDWLSLTAQQKDILSDIITEFKKNGHMNLDSYIRFFIHFYSSIIILLLPAVFQNRRKVFFLKTIWAFGKPGV